jgi:hypothetical protein
MKNLTAFALALALTAPHLAHAEESPLPPAAASPAPAPLAVSPVEADGTSESDTPPSRGVGLLVAGGIFTGIGAINLLTSPICKTDLVGNRATQDACFTASLVLGGTFLAIGVPMLVVGGVKRSKFKRWQADHPLAAGLGFSPATGGGALTLGGQF